VGQNYNNNVHVYDPSNVVHSATLPTAVVVGQTVLVWASSARDTGFPLVNGFCTDNLGNTYTKLQDVVVNSEHNTDAVLWYTVVTVAGTCTVTVPNAKDVGLSVICLVGADTTSPIDVSMQHIMPDPLSNPGPNPLEGTLTGVTSASHSIYVFWANEETFGDLDYFTPQGSVTTVELDLTHKDGWGAWPNAASGNVVCGAHFGSNPTLRSLVAAVSVKDAVAKKGLLLAAA